MGKGRGGFWCSVLLSPLQLWLHRAHAAQLERHQAMEQAQNPPSASPVTRFGDSVALTLKRSASFPPRNCGASCLIVLSALLHQWVTTASPGWVSGRDSGLKDCSLDTNTTTDPPRPVSQPICKTSVSPLLLSQQLGSTTQRSTTCGYTSTTYY